MNRVVIVSRIPPNTRESVIVASLKIYGPIKSFGLHQNMGFVDYENHEDAKRAIKNGVVINGWKSILFFGNSITKNPRKPYETTDFEEEQAFIQNDLSRMEKYKVSGFPEGISNYDLYRELDIPNMIYGREYIWCLTPPISTKYHIVWVPQRECYKCFQMNDSEFTKCIFCGTEREFCNYCNSENIPQTNYCCRCGECRITNQK